MPPSKLFALGSNASGQLGTGHTNDTSVPQRCIFDVEDVKSLSETDKIVKIVAGGNHTLVLFESGAVFAAGNNEHGQCGLSRTSSRMTMFRRVVLEGAGSGDDARIFTDIAATWSASFLVQKNETIYVFGSGSRGELGLGEGVTHTQGCSMHLSHLIKTTSKIDYISGGMSHVVLLNSEGEAIGWGASRKGQLGEDVKELRVSWNPTRITLPFEARRVVTGRDFTFFSNDMGSTILFGENKQLNNYTTLGDFDHLVAGWSNIYAQSQNRVIAIGRSDRGQLPPAELPRLKMISAGSEHCLGLTSTGDAIAWGWGEHGNCGEMSDATGNVAGRWNHLPVLLGDGESITRVAAGCATSFIVVDGRD
jgi:protein ATS1